MNLTSDLVIEVIARPETLSGLSPRDWGHLVRQARSANLLARVAEIASASSPHASPPAAVLGHFESALRVIRAQHREVFRELGHIREALADLGEPVVVLKGAAYLAAGLPPSSSRVFSDVDILVPKAAIDQAESLLMLAGWMGAQQDDDYYQHYYRKWAHELPPMEHVHRRTTLDVHHTILPETARLRPDPKLLVEAARPLEDHPGLFVLAPPDMLLHSMTHLFMNEETSHALRDLADLDQLLRHFGADPSFWGQLILRAHELDLARVLYYGLRHTAAVLGTPVPAAAIRGIEAAAPSPPVGHLMDTLWVRALRTPAPETPVPGWAPMRFTKAALFALLVRGHWLRMPPWLLVQHLTMKALRRLRSAKHGSTDVSTRSQKQVGP